MVIQPGAPDRGEQRGLNGKLRFCVPQLRRRHGVDLAIRKLVAAGVFLGPGEKLIYTHFRFSAHLHAAIIAEREGLSKSPASSARKRRRRPYVTPESDLALIRGLAALSSTAAARVRA